MAQKTITVTNGGIFLPILCVLFIALKLNGNIDWSWWLVLAPILWPLYVLAAIAGVGCIVLLFVGFIALIATIFEART